MNIITRPRITKEARDALDKISKSQSVEDRSKAIICIQKQKEDMEIEISKLKKRGLVTEYIFMFFVLATFFISMS